jgi:hypothetical protein
MGAYAMQGRMSGGRPTYKGGRDDDTWVWYYADSGEWNVGSESDVGTNAAFLSVVDSAATPDAAQATWEVGEGLKRNRSLKVERTAGSTTLVPHNRTTDLWCCFAGDGLRISGLPAGHDSAFVLGAYTKQPGTEGGRPTYKGGEDGEHGVWYHAGEERWWVGDADDVGTDGGYMMAEGQQAAATPDAVPAGKWDLSQGHQPSTAVKCTRL